MSWGEAKWIVNQIPIVSGAIVPGDDNLTTVLSGTFTQSNNSSKVIGNFTIPAGINGNVRFKATLKTSNASAAAVFAITDTTATFYSRNINTVTNMRGYVTTTSTTGEMVHLDLNVTAGETLYVQICGMSTNTSTLTNVTMGYDTTTVVLAKLQVLPSVQQGYLPETNLDYTNKDNDVNMYYASVTLPKPVSSNNIVLFMPFGNSGYSTTSGSGMWRSPGFGRVVGNNELRLYSPYDSYSTQFSGYWYVIDFGG